MALIIHALCIHQTLAIEGTTTTVQFVFIDTIILCGATHPNEGGAPPGPHSRAMADSEWEWINSTLSNSTADWIFVFGHYPGKEMRARGCVLAAYFSSPFNVSQTSAVWSVGANGPTQLLVEQLRPLLLQYKVAGYELMQ